MITAASGQLGPGWSEAAAHRDRRSFTASVEAGRRVQIQALDEESAEMAKQILQDRHDRVRKPVKVVGRKLACQDDGASQASESKMIRMSRKFSKTLFLRLPILSWMSQIKWKGFRADVIAGVTVGVMAIPQSMSYAKIAGLPYVVGLYSACVPTIIYAVFGQSRQLAVGPVAMVSLLIEAGLQGLLTKEQCPEWYNRSSADEMKQQYEFCPEPYTKLAILTAMIVGIIQVISSFLRLGFIVSFLGHSVISGFTSAAAIIIGLSQVKYILGFDIAKSELIYETLWNILSNLDKSKPMTMFLGVTWFCCLFATKKIAGKYKRLSILGAMGPLISCLAGILLVMLCPPLRDDFNVSYVGEIKDGLFPVTMDWNLGDLGKVMPTAVTVTLIGYMESIAISKNLASKHKYEVEASQELLALGMSNFVGSMFSCYPVTGSFSRSAVNNATGANSQLAGLTTGIIMFCTLMFLTPLFYYLPKFVLAAIVINSILALIAVSEAKRLWRVKRSDFMLWAVAFLGTLFLGVLMGLIIAVALSLCIIIYESARPQITILWRIPGTSIYRNVKQESSGLFVPNVFIARIGSSMFFANAAFIKDMILTYTLDLAEINPTEYIVLEMTPVVSMDATAVHCVQDLVHHFRSQGIQVAFAMVGNRVEKTMRKAKLTDFVGKEWFFHTVDEAVQYCVKHQNARNITSDQLQNEKNGAADPDLETGVDAQANEGRSESDFSIDNDVDHKSTIVSINRLLSAANSRKSIVGDVMSAFEDLNAFVTKTRVEVSGDELEKHFYIVKDASLQGPLTEATVARLREVLSALLGRNVQVSAGTQHCIRPLGVKDAVIESSGSRSGEEQPQEEPPPMALMQSI